MGDGFFYLGLLVMLFILWVSTGGPTRPISFSGAYITPITDVGETQSGYGPQVKLGGTLSVGNASATVGEKPAAPTITYTSSYAGLVSMRHTATRAQGTSVKEGYVQIYVSSGAGKDVDVTGWKISDTAGATATIPNGILVMHIGAKNKLQDVLLRPGDVASLSNETSPVGSSFEVNRCAGYLSSTQASYNPCVASHVTDPGFLTGTWYVYLAQKTPVWKSSGDTLTLLDRDGKTVTSTTY